MASERLDKYGNTVVAGDLVLDCGVEQPQQSCSDDEHREVKVKVLTDEEAKSGKYTMFDVVLPLPGSESIYPSNEIAESYRKALEKDGLSTEILIKRRGTYSVRGGYRNVIVRPGAVEWKVVYYTDPIQKLIETDADRVKKVPPMAEHRTPAEVPIKEGEVLRKALCIGFNLQSCAYATMCYRELLKKPTSQSYQTNLQKTRK